MSVLNGEAYLRLAIDSILGQGFIDFEMLIIDNASTDGTAAILDSYIDARIVRLRNDRVLTLTESLNRGLNKARGKYVARLDSDDVASPIRLERQVDYLDSHENVVLIGTHARKIDDHGTVIGEFTPPIDSEELYQTLAHSNPFVHSAVMFRRDAAFDGYPKKFIYAQDFALWLVLAQRGRLAMIGEPLVDMREHGTRIGRSPMYEDARIRETVGLYRLALQLPALTLETRQRGRIELARRYYFFSIDYWRGGRPLAAIHQLASCFMIAPIFCLERLWVRVKLVRKLIQSKFLS